MTWIALPGTLQSAVSPLGHYRPAEIHEALACVPGGGLWLDVGTGNPAYVRELVAAGCRVVAVNLNPFTHLALQHALHPIPETAINAAIAHLLDRPKGDRPLVHYFRELYRSRCPRCGRMGVAQQLIWEREGETPVRKQIRCAVCGSVEGVTDEEDARALERFKSGGGPAYHLALRRAALQAPEQADALKDLLALYHPRVLSVLMDLIPRMGTLRHETERFAARALLVTLCDRGTRLWGDGPPRSFHFPAQWREMNPEALLLQARQALLCASGEAIAEPSPSLEALLTTRAPGYVLLNWPVRKLRLLLAPETLDGILVHPPMPNALYWALSALWRCWLWDEAAPAGLLAFLERRRMDWEWSRRALALTLRSLQPYLRPDGLFLLHTPGLHLPALAAAIAAAADAGLTPVAWSVSAAGARLALGRVGGGERKDAAARAVRGQVASASGAAGRGAEPSRGRKGALAEATEALTVEGVLRARGQPTAADVAQACVLITQKEQAPRWLRASRGVGPWLETPDKRWFLADWRNAATPLCERVEAEVLALLQTQTGWTPAALAGMVYTRFLGVLTPEPELVAACIAAYADLDATGRLSLRAEDRPSVREAEVRQCRSWLAALGERLGFRLGFAEGWDVLWEDDVPHYAFRVMTNAALSGVLATPAPPTGRRVVVVPGSRAVLLAWRLKQDAALRARLERERWILLKFRLLRRMMEELQTRAALEAYVGLDPLVEQDGSQLRLSW